MNAAVIRFPTSWFLVAAVAISVLLGVAGGALLRSDPFSPIVAQGEGLEAKVDSALRQVEARYPHVELNIRGLSFDGILVQTGWEKPEAGSGEFAAEVRARVEDQREATVAFLQALARAHPSLQMLGAAEDGLLVPIWSRRQILEAGDPRRYRVFEAYSAFQLSARELAGYGAISGTIGRDRDR